MKFEDLSVKGFGNLADLEVKFHSHLNVILAPNESGKSTLTECLYRCLYGFLTQKKEKESMGMFQPMRAERYAARLVMRDSGEKAYEVERDFAAQTVRVRNAVTGEDLTGQFPTERRGQHLLFAEDLLGVSRDIYRSICFIAQGEVDTLDNGDELSGQIRRLADSSGQDSDHKAALDKLDKSLDRMGKTERKTGSEYALACAKVRDLQSEQSRILDSRKEREQIEERLERLREHLEQAEKDRSRLDALNLALQLARVNSTLKKFESLEQEIEQLEEKRGELDRYKSVPVEIRDELHLNRDRAEKLALQIKEHEKAVSGIDEELASLKNKLEGYEAFAGLPEDAVEKMDAWEAAWKKERRELEFLAQWIDQARQARQRIEQQLAELNAKVDKFSEVLQGDLGATNEQLNQLIEEVSQEAVKQNEIRFRSEQLQKRQDNLAGKKKQTAIILTILSLLAFVASVLIVTSEFPDFLLVVLGSAGFAFFFHWQRSFVTESRSISAEQAAVDELKQEVLTAEQRKQDALHSADVPSMKDLNELLNLRKDLQAKLSDDSVLKDLLQERERREAEFGQTVQEMRAVLSQCDLLGDEEEIVGEHLSRFKDGFKKQRLLTAKMKARSEKRDELARNLDAWKGERDSLQTKVREALDQAKAETFEEYEAACAKRNELNSVMQRIENLREQCTILVGNQGEKELLEKREEILKSLEECGEAPEIRETDASREKALVEQIPRKEQEISDLQQKIAAEEARLQERWESERSLAEIEEDLQEAQARLDRLELYREAVAEAQKLIQESATEFHERVFAPEMSARCGDLVKAATGGRYNEILLEKDLSMVRVRGPETGLFQAPWLSRGAVEQVYFALRVGIGQFLTRGRESLPLILDDTFANTDDQRLPEVCRLVLDLSQSSQIILLTCHRRQIEALEKVCGEREVALGNEEVGPFRLFGY